MIDEDFGEEDTAYADGRQTDRRTTSCRGRLELCRRFGPQFPAHQSKTNMQRIIVTSKIPVITMYVES